MRDGVNLAQVTEIGRLLQGFLSNGPEVDILNGSVDEFFWLVEGCQPIQSIVRYLSNTDVSLTWIRERVFGKLRLSKNSEQGALADLR
jgi:hypothetical protein